MAAGGVGGRIEFDGLVNARDVGGPAVPGGTIRRGVLYRSETPELMSAADVARAVDELGLVRTIDLRGGRGGSYPLGDGGRRLPMDFFALAGGMGAIDPTHDGFLASALGGGGVAVGRFLQLFAEADGPCLVHCHTGKDRTGFVVALTLALLGADDEAIVADYAASVPAYEPMVANLVAAGLGVPPEAPEYARMPPSVDGIRALLAELRAGWESPRAYLVDQGVPEDLLDRVVDRLVEPDPRT